VLLMCCSCVAHVLLMCCSCVANVLLMYTYTMSISMRSICDVCMYTCMYVYTHVCTYMHAVCMYTCMYTRMYARIRMHACMCVCMYACMHACMCVCLRACMTNKQINSRRYPKPLPATFLALYTLYPLPITTHTRHPTPYTRHPTHRPQHPRVHLRVHTLSTKSLHASLGDSTAPYGSVFSSGYFECDAMISQSHELSMCSLIVKRSFLRKIRLESVW